MNLTTFFTALAIFDADRTDANAVYMAVYSGWDFDALEDAVLEAGLEYTGDNDECELEIFSTIDGCTIVVTAGGVSINDA